MTDFGETDLLSEHGDDDHDTENDDDENQG